MQTLVRARALYYFFSLCIALATITAAWALGGVIAYKSLESYRFALASVLLIMVLVRVRVVVSRARIKHGGAFYIHMCSVAVFVPSAISASISLFDAPHLLFELVTKADALLLTTGIFLFLRGFMGVPQTLACGESA